MTCFLYKQVGTMKLFIGYHMDSIPYALDIAYNVGLYYVINDSNRKAFSISHPRFKNISCNKKY